MANLTDGPAFVSCSRSEPLVQNNARTYYRVSVAPSWGGYLTNTRFSDALAQLGSQLQAKSGDAVALMDPVPKSVSDEYGIFTVEPVTVDVMTLGAARLMIVGNLVDVIEATAPVAVQRVERVPESAVRGADRFTARDALSQANTPSNPLADAGRAVEKLGIGILVLAVVVGAVYILPRR